jgi:Na+-translocating ferredoxin:NAD+ oxidoreductase RNF subunit RnfB
MKKMSDVKQEDVDLKYNKVINVLNKAGEFPIPASETTIGILKHTIKEEDLDFVMAFKRKISQTMEQLLESSKLSEEEILTKVKRLASKGVMFDQPNRHGVMVFRLLPITRQFEYNFMKKLEHTEENKELGRLFKELNDNIGQLFQNDYDNFLNMWKKMPAIDRTVPYVKNSSGDDIQIIIDTEIDVPIEKIIPTQQIDEIVKKFDDIAVGKCFCRQHEEILGHPCKQIELVDSCFTLGKSARHTSKHGFSRLVSQEEALDILKICREAGLVHKAYHLASDINKEEVAICNCCGDGCCPNSMNGAFIPQNNVTNFIAEINPDLCTGCETCVEKCHNSIIELNDDDKAERIEEFCIGCGVCAYFCPENAIALVEKKKTVQIIPPRKN